MLGALIWIEATHNVVHVFWDSQVDRLCPFRFLPSTTENWEPDGAPVARSSAREERSGTAGVTTSIPWCINCSNSVQRAKEESMIRGGMGPWIPPLGIWQKLSIFPLTWRSTWIGTCDGAENSATLDRRWFNGEHRTSWRESPRWKMADEGS